MCFACDHTEPGAVFLRKHPRRGATIGRGITRARVICPLWICRHGPHPRLVPRQSGRPDASRIPDFPCRRLRRTGERARARKSPAEAGLFDVAWPGRDVLVQELAPRDGFEPPAKRLTAACSTAELPGIRVALYSNTTTRAQSGCRHGGGPGRNRTDVQGFAVLCITTLPPGPGGRYPYRPPPRRASPNTGRAQFR